MTKHNSSIRRLEIGILITFFIYIILFTDRVYAEQKGGLKQNRATVTFTITHHTIDAGYQTISGGSYQMEGIVGQAEHTILSGSNSVFISGFLSAASPLVSELIFKDSFE